MSQATSLCFHPQKQILISGWENGEIHVWISGKREFMSIQGSGYHKSPVMLVEFSEQGGRLVTADSVSFCFFISIPLSIFKCFKKKYAFTEWNNDWLEM